MSITRRILEGAQSGLSKLTSLVIVDDEPLSHVESAALQVELTARKAARAKATRQPLENPLAKLAMANPGARAQRDRAAKDRAAKVHRERDERANAAILTKRKHLEDFIARNRARAATAGLAQSKAKALEKLETVEVLGDEPTPHIRPPQVERRGGVALRCRDLAIGYPDLVQIFTGTVLNQTGQAVEVVAITMLVYLTISLLTSLAMNIYNSRIALVER